MAEAVDSVIAEFVIKGLEQYESSFNRASAAHTRFGKTVDSLQGQTFDLQAEGRKYKAGADLMASSEEQSAAKIAKARKTRSDSAKASSDIEKKAAKDAADAAKAAAKERSDAAKAAAKAEADAAKEAQKRASATADAERRLEISARNATRAQIEELQRLRAAEAQSANQVRANAFLTGQGNLSGQSARGSASVFREQFKQEAQDARDAAAAERELAKAQRDVDQASRKRGSVSVASDLFSAGGGVKRGTGSFFGTSEPGSRASAAAQTEAMRAVRVEAEQTAVAEAQVDAAMVEQTRLQAGLLAARGEDRVLIREQISDMRTYNQLLKTGLTEEAAAVELETIRAARVKARTEQEAAANRNSTSSGLRKAFEGATLGYAPSGAAFAGVAVAGVAAAGAAAVAGGLDYAKQIKDTADAVGLTTKQVQVYGAAAREAGVSTDQFRSGIGQLNSYLGKAKEGDEQAAKTFAALGISIKDAGSAGDILPTLIDRLSSIKDPAQRAAVETRLFGEEGRRLDSVLSGGNDKINELAAALEATGAVLSSDDIAKLDDTSKKLAEVKAELSVDIAKVVADNADAIRDLASAFAFLADRAGAAFSNYANLRKLGYDPFTSLGGAAVGAITGQRAVASTPDTSKSPAVQAGSTGDLSKLFAPKGPRGKSANQLAAEAEQRTKRFNDELARYQDQQLSAQADMTGDIQERAAIENQLSLREAARAKADIDSQAKINISHGANSELERARASILKAAVDQANQAESDAREQQVAADLSKQQNEHLQTRLSIEAELLDGSQEFARTAKERLAIQLRLLEIEKEQERANLQNQIDTAKPGTDLTSVRAQLGSLDARYGERAQVAAHQNLGPLAAYADSLPRTAGEIEESFEKAAVNGIEALNSGLDKSVAKALHLHGIAGQILSDFIDIGLKAAEAQLFGGSGGGGLGGLFGGGGLGGLLGAVFGGGTQGNANGVLSAALGASNTSGFASILGSLPGLAGGGSFDILGNGGVDRNLLSINGKPVARVNMGERVNISPTGMNSRVHPSAAGVTVLAPQHFDLSGAVLTSDLVAQIDQRNKAYTDAVGKAAYTNAVSTSGKQAPGAVRKAQILGN
jgi:hypothetical protein